MTLTAKLVRQALVLYAAVELARKLMPEAEEEEPRLFIALVEILEAHARSRLDHAPAAARDTRPRGARDDAR